MSQVTTPVIAANWKMHNGPTETRQFLREFIQRWKRREDRTVVFFPPAVSLPAFLETREGREDLLAGIQDVHQEAEGAHTGAVSAAMAADAGAVWGLAGHSERRHEFGDTPEVVASKVRRLEEFDIRPVLCVGETLVQRQEGQLEAVLARQTGSVLDQLAPTAAAELVYAYEPVWAIGTGKTASPEDAGDAHSFLRTEIASHLGDEVAREAPILYGGSVKPYNAEELLAVDGIDGVLVGSGSLDPAGFAEICAAGS